VTGALCYVDTHVHLDDTRYDPDREALLDRAREAGVRTLVSIGTALEDSVWAADFAARTPGVYAAVGVHPERAGEFKAEQMGAFAELARAPKVVAVGEVGLDYHREGASLAEQEPTFRAMIALARAARKPLVIHCREASEDTLRILREDWEPSLGGVFHCFAGDAAAAKGALDLNFDIAVGGVLTFKNAQALRDVVREVPLGRLVLETDGPWLAPQAWRGKRNEPAYVPAVAAQLAQVKGLPLEAVAEATTRNARRLFGLNAETLED